MPNQTETLKHDTPARNVSSFEQRKDPSSRKFYQTKAWKKLRARVMKKFRRQDELRVNSLYEMMPNTSLGSFNNWWKSSLPLCAHCIKEGYIRPGNVADHIVRIEQGGEALKEDNIQPLCNHHHNIKSGKEAHE